MFLKNITLTNFRNYEHINLSFDKKLNIFYGNNAQGKTNLLESIYFLCLINSTRIKDNLCLIKDDKNFMIIEGNIYFKNLYSNLYLLMDSNNKKILKKDDNKISKISGFINNLKIILFTPDDLFLIKDSKEVRRKYFNLEISQINKKYYEVLLEYNKLLKERNFLLKELHNNKTVDLDYFEILTNSIVEKNLIIMKNRNIYISKINEIIENIYSDLANIRGFNIEYIPSIKIDFKLDNKENIFLLKKYLKNNYFLEIKSGKTLFGVNYDDYEFKINNNNIKNFGSQGQQRMAILALKLSEMEIFKKYCGEYPILLLDDVFSELDDMKKNNLLKYIINNTQTFITTTNLENLNKELISKSKLFEIVEGKVLEVNNNG